MLKIFYIFIWITVFTLCYCQQNDGNNRMMGLGNESILGKKYLVYFVKSAYSKAADDAWICAGAIVTPTQILTAAACLVDMNNIYAIAGYKKYVHGRDIEKDKCTKTTKKRVVRISVPKEYTKSICCKVDWMNIDIGVATVQKPYNFHDQSYLTHCCYIPQSILINYDKQNEAEKTRAIALGWGGDYIKNKTNEKLKPQLLQEATTTVINNTICANTVAKNGSKELVYKYLLCSSGNDFLRKGGDVTTLDPLMGVRLISSIFVTNTQKTESRSIKDVGSEQKNTNAKKTSKLINKSKDNAENSRKSSLVETCQNDHGGPLVTWVGTEAMILGVALNGICNPNFDCVGPRIYVSTASTANIIKCLLETNETRRKSCNGKIDDERYQVIDIEVKWPEELEDNTNTSSTKIQQSASFRRRMNNTEKPLQKQKTNGVKESSIKKKPQSKPHNNSQDNPQKIQTDNQHNNKKINSQKIPYNKSKENLHLNNQAKNPKLDPYYEQQRSVQADQKKESSNESLGYQKCTGFFQRSQQEVETQYKQKTDTFNPLQMKLNIQPQLDSYNNKPQINFNPNDYPPSIESKNSPETEYEIDPKKKLFPQSLVQLNNQKLMQLYRQLKLNLFKEPRMTTQIQPKRPINIDESKSIEPLREINNNLPQTEILLASKLHSYNFPQIQLFKPRQTETFKKALKNMFRLSSFKQSSILNASFNIPEAETLNDTEARSPQPKVKFLNATQALTVKSIHIVGTKSTRPYNPLDIIMSEKLPEDDLFKHIKPNVEPVKESSVNPDIHQRINSLLEQKYVSNSLDVQPSSRKLNQAANIMRQRNLTSHLLQSQSQSFEQILSQLHALRSEFLTPAKVATEETFEELYSKLHDGKFDVPPNEDFVIELLQKSIKRNDEQRAKLENKHPAVMHLGNKVLMRQQKPLNDPDDT